MAIRFCQRVFSRLLIYCSLRLARSRLLQSELKYPLHSLTACLIFLFKYRVLYASLAVVGLALVLTPVCAITAGGPVKGRVALLNIGDEYPDGKLDASNIVVWLEPLNPAQAVRSGAAARHTINQQDKRFLPHVVVVESGSTVDFPNNDPYFHNIFSIYNGKRFDLGLYASGETRPVQFNRPGLSYIYCNIHPQMSAIVVTVNTPYFAVSGAKGDFAIANVPEGRYRLQVWHERARAQVLSALTREVKVGAGGLELGVINISEEGYLLRPHPDKYGGEYDPHTNRPYRRY
jgi:plastocyanin